MATLFSPSALFSAATTTTTTSTSTSITPSKPPLSLTIPPSKPPSTTLTAVALAAATILTTTPPSLADSPTTPSYQIYYGTAASAANYGGYGGNSNKKDSAEYVYDVPEGWKERLVSKVEKGTNGTDSEFYNPKKKAEKEYLLFLSGIRQLAPKEAILNNLALSDVDLQDLIASADNVTSEETKDEKGQVYYVYEIVLTLSYTHLKWNEMQKIGMLPNLKVLKLKIRACFGERWETGDGGFRCLKYLKLKQVDIVQWNASSEQFPNLQHLKLVSCRRLKEIPLGLGDIYTLEMIEVMDCSSAVEQCALKMKEDQESKGNDFLKISVSGPKFTSI